MTELHDFQKDIIEKAKTKYHKGDVFTGRFISETDILKFKLGWIRYQLKYIHLGLDQQGEMIIEFKKIKRKLFELENGKRIKIKQRYIGI